MSVFNRKLLGKLERRLTSPIDSFRKLGDVVETPDGPAIHIDNGGSVLAVAHMDYVKFWNRPKIDKAKQKVYCPQLDDRLGVWVILDLLPTMGLKYDVLLTDSEEVGRSTASSFKTTKQYNWMFQFDRHGTDTVLYRYDTKDNRKRLESHGLKCGYGSFSDICYLDHLGCSGWNVGTGYHHEHSDACYADLRETRANAYKFAKFFKEHSETFIESPPYKEPTWQSYGTYYSGKSTTPSHSRDAWGWAEEYYGQDDDGSLSIRNPDSVGYSLPAKYNTKTATASVPSHPNRRHDDDWICNCGLVNHWNRLYCKDCGMSFDDAVERPHTQTEAVWGDAVRIPDDLCLEDWDLDKETYRQFAERKGIL